MEKPENIIEAMGFDTSQAKSALLKANGDVQLAIDMLLSGLGFDSEDAPGPGTGTGTTGTGAAGLPLAISPAGCRVLELRLSQYTFGSAGTSACTSIGCYVGVSLLESLQRNHMRMTHTAHELETLVAAGVSSHGGVSGDLFGGESSHLTAEEVYITSQYLQEKATMLTEIPLQGLLVSSGHREAFGSVFEQARSIGDPTKAIAVVITKPPETICVVLPPKVPVATSSSSAAGPGDSTSTGTSSRTSSQGTQGDYILFDSHSRPQFNLYSSYAMVSDRLEPLMDYMQELFPKLQLDGEFDDTGFLGAMYDSYEGTLFQSK